MPRAKTFEIRSVNYDSNGATLTIHVPAARSTDAPASILAALTGGKAAAKPRRARKGNKAAAVLVAIKAGAKAPAEIAKKSGVDKKQVHAYLAYHKRRGNVTGNAGEGFKLKN